MPRQYTFADLTGRKFERLTVISLAYNIPGKTRVWNCQCDCGALKQIRGSSLIKPNGTKSCGCYAREMSAELGRKQGPLNKGSKLIKAGQRFGMLVALEYLSVRVGWKCKCDCGGERYVRTSDLTRRRITSCTCKWKSKTRGLCQWRNKTHGLSGLPEYNNWASMMMRCTNPNDVAYPKYGGAGILPCAGLRNSPKCLLDSLGSKSSPELELDRIKNTLGYFCGVCDECKSLGRPCNIRWATRKQQQRNRNNNALFSINGETKCASEWAEQFGLKWQQFSYRYRANRIKKDLV